uniref:Uncharacterized protein n=1 Tax=Oryza rufipogon TaxID=4529 RepID=A0A0E0QHY6_ORYRU
MQLGKVEMSFMVPVEVTRGSMRGVIVDVALGGGGEANSTSEGDLGRWRRGQLLQEFEASQQWWLGEAHKASLEECASEATQVTWAVLGIVIVVGAAALRLHSGGGATATGCNVKCEACELDPAIDAIIRVGLKSRARQRMLILDRLQREHVKGNGEYEMTYFIDRD